MQKYALIGRDHGHSQFRRIHNEIADYEYDELDVQEEGSLEEILRDTRYSGFNISGPYKYEVLKYLDEISYDARRAGAADVVRRLPDGKPMRRSSLPGPIRRCGQRIPAACTRLCSMHPWRPE